MSLPIPNEQVRLWLYGVITVVLTVLVAYKLIDPTAVPLWLSLAGTVLGVASSGTATMALTKQRKARKPEPKV